MPAEGWYDGTWNDWRWRTTGQWNSSSSSTPQAGWTWHDWERPSPWSKQGSSQWSSPVDTTSNDPRQNVANGAKSFHWTKSWLGWRPACWTPAKAKPKNRLMSGAGDSRRDLRQQKRRRSGGENQGVQATERRLCKEKFLCIKNSQERTLPKV